MADLSRERIAEIRANVESVANGGDEVVHLAQGEWEALLSMAERAVSEETVRKLAEALHGYPPGMGSSLPRPSMREIGEMVASDLRPAAARLAEGKG